jgi:hypothetical protein
LTWTATLDLWLWDADPAALAFVASVLGTSEVLRIAQKVRS